MQYNDAYYVLDKEAEVVYKDSSKPNEKVAMLIGGSVLGYDQLQWDNYIVYAPYASEQPEDTSKISLLMDSQSLITASSEIEKIKFDLLVYDPNEVIAYEEAYEKWENAKTEEEKNAIVIPTITDHFVACELGTTVDSDGIYQFESTGLSMYLSEYQNTFGEAVKATFKDFGYSAGAIVRGLGQMFTSKEAREQAGGIIAIGFETTNILKNFGLDKFIYVWGLISVNLAILNLVPFPGLDGWQLLVLFIEKVFKKQVSEKTKNIISWVGLIIVFGLMALLVVKDAIKYIF